MSKCKAFFESDVLNVEESEGTEKIDGHNRRDSLIKLRNTISIHREGPLMYETETAFNMHFTLLWKKKKTYLEIDRL